MWSWTMVTGQTAAGVAAAPSSMNFFKRALNRKDTPRQGPASQPPDSQVESRLPDLDAQTSTRSQLLRVVTRDTLRHCGIPQDWIECQVSVVARRQGVTQLAPKLVVRHWDDRLMRYLPALERRLLAAVQDFEQDALEWLRPFSWTFPAENCPHTEMPDPSFWNAGSAPPAPGLLDEDPAPPVALPLLDSELENEGRNEIERDLAELFAVRDTALAELRSGDSGPLPMPDFAPTQPRTP